MADLLRSLLDVRRDAERKTCVKLNEAIAARANAEAVSAQLRQALCVARAALRADERAPRDSPKRAALAQAGQRYRERLAAQAQGAAKALAAHVGGPLANAVGAEGTARAAYEVARKELAAALKLEEHSQAAATRRAARRAEDAAADHANAMFVRTRQRK